MNFKNNQLSSSSNISLLTKLLKIENSNKLKQNFNQSNCLDFDFALCHKYGYSYYFR